MDIRERYGQDITRLVAELERIRETKLDVVVAQKNIEAVAVPEQGPNAVKIVDPNLPRKVNNIQLHVADSKKDYGTFGLNRIGTVQLANRLGLPVAYYDKMLKEGLTDLTAENVNQWLRKYHSDNRLVRIADGHIRAYLSAHYKILDNVDLAYNIMDRARQHNAVITDAALTESRMYIKLTVPKYVQEIRKGDRVVPGMMVSNSEVGEGAFRVEGFLYRLVCQNGLIATDSLYKVHIGGRMELGEVGQIIYKDDTQRKMNEALWAQIRDHIDVTFNPEALNGFVNQLRKADGIEFTEKETIQEVDRTVKDLGLSDDRKMALVKYFAKDGDTLFGLVNGITRLAQDFPAYDERVHVERYAGQVLEARVPTVKPRVVA